MSDQASAIASSIPGLDPGEIGKKVAKADIAGLATDELKMAKAQKDTQDKLSGDYIVGVKADEEKRHKIEEGMPKVPDLQSYQPPAPTDPWQLWGSPTMVLAGLSGFVGRRSAAKALDAAEGVMKASNEKDASVREEAFKKWKVENENAGKMFEWQNQVYERALKAAGRDEASRKAVYETVSHMNQDPAMLDAVKEGVHVADRLQTKRQEDYRMSLQYGDKVWENHMEQKFNALRTDAAKAEADHAAAFAPGADPALKEKAEKELADVYRRKQELDGELADKASLRGAEKPGTGGNTAKKFTPEMGDLLAAFSTRGVSLPAGFRGREQQVATLQGILDKYPDKSADEIADMVKKGQIELGALKKETQAAAGIAGRIEVFDNEIIKSAPILLSASKAVPRGKFVPLGELMQKAESSISDPNLKKLRIYVNSLLNAYDGLAARGGTDQKKREEARSLILTADSHEALKAGVDAFVVEARLAKESAIEATKVEEWEGNPLDGGTDKSKGAEGGEEAKALGAWGAYEPDKYLYGVNPATGKFARAPKESK